MGDPQFQRHVAARFGDDAYHRLGGARSSIEILATQGKETK